MAQVCCFLKLLLLLLMMTRVTVIDTRPARSRSSSDLIAGNEFLKLFLERDEVQRELHSGDFIGRGDSGAVASATAEKNPTNGGRSTSARSLDYKSALKSGNANNNEDAGKQVVKLVTSGSKIVFFEEYDEDDAVVDAVAREIDLQKEKPVTSTTPKNFKAPLVRKATPSDEVKVVAVSVSSSSKRGPAGGVTNQQQQQQQKPHNRIRTTTSSSSIAEHAKLHDQQDRQDQQRILMSTDRRQLNHKIQSHDSNTDAASALLTWRTATVTTTAPTTAAATTSDFINRSHKSEFSIEEVEPLTMRPYKTRRPTATSIADALDDGSDSQNSASTNIHNVLAAPLVQADVTRVTGTGTGTGTQNFTAPTTHDGEEKLLPFQTVIYHDTKEGHGPQSRSISYSSLSQNVEDLHAWPRTAGILAEAQRNVSESLKPMTLSHSSEPAKFYSVPAKMYSVPSKFYSEPAKVYSEPAKVYGEPEKFYSEPAKVYSQPSKFYSEPAKVYSQPAKVYSEPAKSYWPSPPTTTTTSTSTQKPITTTTTPTSNVVISSRRPAIVSRIAFGEAQTSTSVPSDTFQQHTQRQQQQQQHQQQHQHQYQHHRSHNFPHSQAHQTAQQQRRVLFNLDRLPYDLLNAPEQSSKTLLEPDLSSRNPATGTDAFTTAQLRPCLESTLSLSTTQQQQQQQRQQQQSLQRQHSSLSSNQHSNQNAKGLPDRDLVKYVSQFTHTSSAVAVSTAHFTTESSRHIDELYTPTPEQNYEIEESVSVMTNGRAHGVQDIGSLTTTTIAPSQQLTRNRIRFGTSITGGGGGGGSGGGTGSQLQYHSNSNLNSNANANSNSNANANVADGNGADDHNSRHNNHNRNHHYNHNYDDSVDDDDGEDVDATGGHKSGNNASDNADAYNNNGDGGVGGGGGGDDDGNAAGAGDDDDDSKVAYVVEGRNYRKYRVEEKTDDGFIVGEYGVVDHNDGNLRGVRYTADSTINRSLIQKALLTFLKLK